MRGISRTLTRRERRQRQAMDGEAEVGVMQSRDKKGQVTKTKDVQKKMEAYFFKLWKVVLIASGAEGLLCKFLFRLHFFSLWEIFILYNKRM